MQQNNLPVLVAGKDLILGDADTGVLVDGTCITYW